MKSKSDLILSNFPDVGYLKRYIENNNLPDDAILLVERVEDIYYEQYGWKTFKKTSYLYHKCLNLLNDINHDIELQKQDFDTADMKTSMDMEQLLSVKKEIENNNNNIEEMYEEFTQINQVVYHKENNTLLIYLHD